MKPLMKKSGIPISVGTILSIEKIEAHTDEKIGASILFEELDDVYPLEIYNNGFIKPQNVSYPRILKWFKK